MPQQTVDLSVFQGMIGAADPKDIGGNNATVCENVNFGEKKGSLVGFNLDDGALAGTSGSPLENMAPLMFPLTLSGSGVSRDRYTLGIAGPANIVTATYPLPYTGEYYPVVYDEDGNVLYEPTAGYARYTHAIPNTNATNAVDAQARASVVSMGVQSFGGTSLITLDGRFLYSGKSIAYEALLINHNQFQGIPGTATSTLWQSALLVAQPNKTGWTNLVSSPTDLNRLYFLPMEKVGKTDAMLPLDESSTLYQWAPGDTIDETGYALSDANSSYELEAGDYKYFYTAELMYTEETPPREIKLVSDYGDTITTNNNHRFHLITLKIKAENGTVGGIKPDPRVTAYNIYRQYAPTGEAITDVTPKVFIGRVSIEEVQEKRTTPFSITWPGATGAYTYQFDPILGSSGSNRIQTYLWDDVPSSATGPTYEDRTGLPDTFDEYYQYAGFNCQSGSYYFTGKSQIARYEGPTALGEDVIDTPVSTIFRSKSYRPRQIDWTGDFVTVPFRIVGMVGYEGKVFAYGQGSMAVIDAETLSIDDRFDDIGLLHHHLITSTSTGLYWCDKRSIFKYDGRSIERIGAAIEHDADDPIEGWQYKVTLFDPHTSVATYSNFYGAYMGYDPVHNAIIIHITTFFEATPTGYAEWAYFIDTGDWTRITAYQNHRTYLQSIKVGFTGSTLYFSKGGSSASGYPQYGQFFTVGTNSNTSGYTWKSKELGFPGTEYGNRKAIYRVQVHGDASQFQVIEDDSTTANISLSAPSGGIKTGERSGNGNTYFFRQAKIKITGGTNDVTDAISLRFRSLER